MNDQEAYLRRLAELVKTEPMSVDALAKYFLVNWRTMRSMLSVMEGVEQFGKLWRVPVHRMPPSYHKEKKLWPVDCKDL